MLCPGSGVTLWAENYPIGASALGARGLLAEVVGKRATLHQVTNAWVVEQFLGKKVDFEREEGRRVRIKVRGIGFKPEDRQ